MANVFKNYTGTGITTESTLVTGGAGVETTVIGMTIANVGASEAAVDIKLNGVYMLKGAPIFVGGAMVPIGGDQKVVIGEADTLSVTSDVAVDVIVSVLEKS
jgi:hypothetical protein